MRMMNRKTTYLLLAGLLTLAACDNDDNGTTADPKAYPLVVTAQQFGYAEDSEGTTYTKGETLGVYMLEAGTDNIVPPYGNLRYYANRYEDEDYFLPGSNDSIPYFPATGEKRDVSAYYPKTVTLADSLVSLHLVEHYDYASQLLWARVDGLDKDNRKAVLNLRPALTLLSFNLRAGFGVTADDVEFDGKSVRCVGADGAEQEMTVAALANKLIGFGLHPGMLEGHGTNAQPTSPPPYMAGIAEVEVDKATGLVRVTDYAAVVDCGTVINPALARVQAEGGIAQGIGMALTEDVSRDEKGRLRTGSFMTYKLPCRLDVPEPRVEFMPSFEPTGPFGAKSIGEVVINTPSPAIMSAVAHATGRYVRALPITPSKVLLGE